MSPMKNAQLPARVVVPLSPGRLFLLACLLLIELLATGCAAIPVGRDPNRELRLLVIRTAASEGLSSVARGSWQFPEAELELSPDYIATPPDAPGETTVRPVSTRRSAEQLVLPFDVTPEIRAFAEQQVRAAFAPRARILALVQGIYGIGDFEEQYELSTTRTAAEMLTERRGNCFSFTNLFVASARAVGLTAYYMDATRAKSTVRREGSRVIHSGHIVAAVEIDGNVAIIDFSRLNQVDPYHYRRLTDQETAALFINNLGYEALLREVNAVPYFRTSIALAPRLEAPWNNLAAVYMRAESWERAEEILIAAVDAGVESFAPFFNLGLIHMRRGEYELAVSSFKKAYRRKRDNPYLFYNMGLSYLHQGKHEKARRAFQRALDLDDDLEGARSKLDRLTRTDRKPPQGIRLRDSL